MPKVIGSAEMRRRNLGTLIMVVITAALVIAILIMVIILLVNQKKASDAACCTRNVVCTDCDDGNECTIDLCQSQSIGGGALVDIGCSHNDAPNTQACTTICFTDTESSCSGGECVGASCAGDCELDEDCPIIQVNGDSTWFGECIIGTDTDRGACMYSVVLFFDDDFACGAEGSNMLELCEGFLAENETYKDCLRTDALCDPDTGALLYCDWMFSCSKPLLDVGNLALKKRSAPVPRTHRQGAKTFHAKTGSSGHPLHGGSEAHHPRPPPSNWTEKHGVYVHGILMHP